MAKGSRVTRLTLTDAWRDSVEEAMKRKGIKRSELARRVGVKPATITNLLKRGSPSPRGAKVSQTSKHAQKISRELEIREPVTETDPSLDDWDKLGRELLSKGRQFYDTALDLVRTYLRRHT